MPNVPPVFITTVVDITITLIMENPSLDAWPKGGVSDKSSSVGSPEYYLQHSSSRPSTQVSSNCDTFVSNSETSLPKDRPLLTKAALAEHNSHYQDIYAEFDQYTRSFGIEKSSSIPELKARDPLSLYTRKTRSLSYPSGFDRVKDSYYNTYTENLRKPAYGISAESDSRYITSLWNLVRMPPRKTVEQVLGGSASSRAESSTMPASEVVSTETGGSGRGGRKKKEKIKVGPYDIEFETEVLAPRGITREFEPSVRAEAHFNVDKPKGNRSAYYSQSRGAVASPLWLEVDDSTVQTLMRVYACYESENLCEAEYASYAKETLFKMDPFAIVPGEARQWRARRMIELVAQPHPADFWHVPPIVQDASEPSVAVYGFDIRPDCSYWLSVQAFNPSYVNQIREWCFVMKRKMTCPYLTIEFKKDDALKYAAENQVATAGSMALYNRFCLKQECNKRARTTWTKEQLKNIKHYGVTMNGASYHIWCLEPKVTPSFEWVGINMTRVCQGHCASESKDVENLLDWINEIHCWGLTVHGPECQNDVKRSMKTNVSGARVSDIMSGMEMWSDNPP